MLQYYRIIQNVQFSHVVKIAEILGLSTKLPFHNINPRPVAGFFVYRHLGLLECNIVLMVRLLPLLMLTGLLFRQDVLNHKSGE